MALKAGQAKPKERNMNKKDGLSKMTNRLFFREYRLPHNLDIDGVRRVATSHISRSV